jgi:hypothetical protein
MKWIFSILVIANLGMFIWLYPQADDASRRTVIPSNVGDLRLVGEPLAPLQQEPEPVASEDDAAETSSSEQDRVPPMVVTAEQAATQTTSRREPEVAEELPPATPVCGTLGVFEKRSQAELVSVRLLAEKGKTEITAESSNQQAGFWVLIPPQENRAAAIAIAKRLEQAGITDLWRFTSGELAHAISLGLFRDLERAEARSDKINQMGFETEVRPRYREQTQYWLNYRYQGRPALQESYWKELKASFPDLERSEQPCP